MHDQLHLLHNIYTPHLEQEYFILSDQDVMIPGGPIFSLKKINARKKEMAPIDIGLLIYHKHTKNESENYLEIRYCLSGNKYCDAAVCYDCDTSSKKCNSHKESINLYAFRFYSNTLKQFFQQSGSDDEREKVLSFHHEQSFTKSFTLCQRKRMLLQQLSNHGYEGALEKIYLLGKTQELLLYSLECLQGKKEIQFVCKFLSDEEGRNRIYKARDILLDNLGDPITIKGLSRKVAMNECYLKKGFKEIYGTTIFDFYQQKRMEYAETLLNEKGYNVTEVSLILGYSSISHFSAAFKKYTGIKPCELLR